MNKNILRITTILCTLVVFNNSAFANTKTSTLEKKSYNGEHVQTTTTINKNQNYYKNEFGQEVPNGPQYMTSSTTGTVTNSEGQIIVRVDGETTGNGQGTGTTTVTATSPATGESKSYSGTVTKNSDGSYTETGSQGKSITKNTDGSFTVEGAQGKSVTENTDGSYTATGKKGTYNITKVE